MSIQENKKQLSDALDLVRSHPMCAKFFDTGSKFQIIYPDGMCLGGSQATYQGCGKIIALKRLIDVMDRHWIESGCYSNA